MDITGGAPKLNPHFRTLVREARALGKQVIDHCNLTVLFRPGQVDTAEFLAVQCVKVVASLPCYTQANVEKQRGLHVFDPSIRGLHCNERSTQRPPKSNFSIGSQIEIQFRL